MEKNNFNHADLIPALLAMRERGGGFHSALALAWLKADLENSWRLYSQFHDLLGSYGAEPHYV